MISDILDAIIFNMNTFELMDLQRRITDEIEQRFIMEGNRVKDAENGGKDQEMITLTDAEEVKLPF